MAGEPLIGGIPARRTGSGFPPAARIALIYVAARVVTTVFFLVAAQLSDVGSRFGPEAGLGDFILGWDSRWYWIVAETGYPSELPTNDDGSVAENQWAFMPLYAYLAKLVGAPFGSWVVGALVVSLVAGYLACLALYRLLAERVDGVTATWATAFFAAGPLGALFQVGYAEPLFLLWLFLALWLLVRRRFGWIYLLIPAMGFTRPGVLAFALLLGLYGIHRWFTRRTDPLPLRQIVHIVLLAALAVVVGFSWQVIAGIATGDSGAYLATELAWRRNWLGGDAGAAFIPFDGFVQAAAFWFSVWGAGPVVGYVVLAALVVMIAAVLLFDPHVRRLGPEIRLWSASYLLYLLAVFFPQSSLFRLLLPLSPLWGAVAAPRSTVWRTIVLGAALLAQWWWIYNMYALGNNYWQVP